MVSPQLHCKTSNFCENLGESHPNLPDSSDALMFLIKIFSFADPLLLLDSGASLKETVKT